ncbi:MAG: hypothetical protein GY795_51830 [Desulfobacterales bacterium]|nr:hypothetical protein [Desulfobacterales bacterium]
MKTKNINIILILLMVIVLVPDLTAKPDNNKNKELTSDDFDVIRQDISSRIKLLNDIIKSPAAADMKKWKQLSNPHDESEIMFFMNSISDGTEKNYNKNSVSMQKLRKHLKSDSDQSVVLQHLRLALMAYELRPGSSSPYIEIKSISRNQIDDEKLGSYQFSVEAEGVFIANDLSNNLAKHPVKIVFQVEKVPAWLQKNGHYGPYLIYLESISILGNKIY